MGKTKEITVSAPGKIHLLGEHAVVYNKPAIISSVNLRIFVTVKKSFKKIEKIKLQQIVEQVLKSKLKIKIPLYELEIKSDIPVGAGLGSSAASSSTLIAALLTLTGQKWDLKLINELTYEAEKVFHGNPSGGDNSTVVFGGLVWFRKESADLKLIHPLSFSIPSKLSKNFVLINTGKPKESTLEMVEMVSSQFTVHSSQFRKIFDMQEKLVKELLVALKTGDSTSMIRIIRAGERNLENIGVVSKQVRSIIRKIEKSGGAAKICGAGGEEGPTGILLCFHQNKKVVKDISKKFNLEYLNIKLGVEGLRRES